MAEASYSPFRTEPDAAPVRLIVRRVKPTPGSQLALFVNYSYHGCITDREGDTLALEADHRRHAEIENAIRDLKYGVGLNHLPSGRFPANGAWLAVQVMAHNLARWTARIGLGETVVTTKTLRRRFCSLAGRLTRSARRLTLHLPQLGPGKPSSVAPWHGCEPCHSQPDCRSATDPTSPQLAPARFARVSGCMPPWQSRPAPPLRAAIVGSVWLSHAVLIPIYWNRAWIVRLPLPISPCVNASALPFGGSGVSNGKFPRESSLAVTHCRVRHGDGRGFGRLRHSARARIVRKYSTFELYDGPLADQCQECQAFDGQCRQSRQAR